jgi:tRNA threonylcarbamoyladenosine biosynthesis protein TsaB
MRIIGIDTSGASASVALTENGRLIAEEIYPNWASTLQTDAVNAKAKHAEAVLPLLESLLKTSALSLADIGGFAVSIGPGSFTGVRIGLSFVKGLVYGSGAAVIGVSTLFAHAFRVADHEGLICTILDARKGEVYAALFRKAGRALDRLMEDSVSSATTLVELVREWRDHPAFLFVGDGADAYRQLLSESLGTRALFQAEQHRFTMAGAVALLSERRFRSSDVDQLDSLIPAYIRPSNSEFKQRKLAPNL